jgi:ADP-ribose pyrophosphatase YjhB (NUDIX family)
MIFQSHFGVYALVFSAERDAVLLIKKALGCYTGLYDLPGGGMEPEELLEDALQREVQEETDCTVTSMKQLGAFSVLYPHKKEGQDVTLRHLGAIYECAITGTPREGSNGLDDSDGCVWMKVNELNEKNAAPFVLMAVAKSNE